MREIVLDTETTGLSPSEGHRIVEIGAVELLSHMPTGRTLQLYLNPERDMPREAEAVHGLSSAFLKDKPKFIAKAAEFLDFISDSNLIIHNSSFDMAFINAELAAANQPTIANERVVDTLQLARRRHPMGPNSLDALCKRYGIDNAKRTKHGALMDAELLAEVYLELIGGRQTAMSLQSAAKPKTIVAQRPMISNLVRPTPLASRMTEAEKNAHEKAISALGNDPLWTSAS
ncbi:MAG: DNA polymerase III subunit epsilon [Alphaproteobacteria bacterium]|nr:DNA polymerase III subunit epsilon [Alphaproteobacteria bacterium]